MRNKVWLYTCDVKESYEYPQTRVIAVAKDENKIEDLEQSFIEMGFQKSSNREWYKYDGNDHTIYKEQVRLNELLS